LKKYRTVKGAYDGTGSQSALGEFSPLLDYPLVISVSLAGASVKRNCRTFFQLCSGYGLFRWPFVQRLWHEVRMYREIGRGAKSVADDTLAAFFVGCWWLRWTFWHELPDYLKSEDEQDEAQIASEAERMFARARSRYSRRARSRHAARGVPVQEELEGGLE